MATALSASLRLSGITLSWWPSAGDHLLGVALICYVLMSAMSFCETATAGTQAYFRQLQVIIAIRDLWTQFEFDMIKALREVQVILDDGQPFSSQSLSRRSRRALTAFS